MGMSLGINRGLALNNTGGNGPQPPNGFTFVSDEEGNLLTDENGNLYIVGND